MKQKEIVTFHQVSLGALFLAPLQLRPRWLQYGTPLGWGPDPSAPLHPLLMTCLLALYCLLSRLLLEGCPLIAVHKVRYYKRGDGLALGPGPFVTALEFASDVKAEVVGKPHPSFFAHALNEMGCDPQSAVMIGDVSQMSG